MLYEHDCGECVYLGEYKTYDLWAHYRFNEPSVLSTVIARWGSEGWEYKSGLGFVGRDIELSVAHDRATYKGEN